MHVAILADALALQRAGIYHYGLSLVQHLLDRYPTYTFTLVSPLQIHELDIDHELVPIRSLPGHQRLRQFLDIPRAINRIKPDVAIELAHFGPFTLEPQIKRVTVVHDLTPLTHPQFHGMASTLAHRIFLPGVIRRANRLIVNSQSTADEIEAKWPKSTGRISIYYPLNEARSSLPRSTLPEPYYPYFLTVGSLEPRKNLVTLLDGFEKFCASSNSLVQLHIVGGDEWKNQAFKRRLIDSPFKDRVILHGHVPRQDLNLLYDHCLAYVSASWSEGFGLPVLEAMQRGVALLLSKIKSYQEIAGPACWSFAPSDPEMLAAKMGRLVDSERDRILLAESSQNQYQRFLLKRKELPGPLDAL